MIVLLVQLTMKNHVVLTQYLTITIHVTAIVDVEETINMKFWRRIINNNKSYEDALNYIKTYPASSYITRPEWDGIHFISKDGSYCILLKTGQLLIDVPEAWSTDKTDWIIVTITDETVKLLESKGLI
jgi:hypothetical protein